MRLKEKVAVVTGAGRGIGYGIAEKLAREGATTIVVDIGDTAEEAAEKLAEAGADVHALRCDVTKRDDAERVVDEAVERFGGLDVLVNNAGINRDAMLHKMDDEQWSSVIDTNLNGVFYTTRRAAAHMREQQRGSIVNISSASWLGSLGQANYAAAKAGVVGLTLTAARELGRAGVRANVICPGFIDTPMTRGVPESIWDKVVERIPMGRAGEPSDVANLVSFLASDESSYVTGQVVYVSGGLVW
ncbi:MAG TPA: 3-oxoacyl-ACP reductase FabG [Gaiellaceae bacterium]|jgi:3-oxoacyl-[acyl-carrier protein] reductase/2-hydroxycyclohexanecarboxyl-CoA dehydrogenase